MDPTDTKNFFSFSQPDAEKKKKNEFAKMRRHDIKYESEQAIMSIRDYVCKRLESGTNTIHLDEVQKEKVSTFSLVA